VEPGGPLTRAQVVLCIVIGLVCVVLATAAVTFLPSGDASPPTTPEHAVEGFVDAFNEKDFGRLCDLSSPAIRAEFESVGFGSTLDDDAVDRAFEHVGDDPDAIGCVIGAEAVSRRVGRISSGTISKTARETRRLAYATTARGRWKLTSDGATWTVARHPRLETLAEDGDG